MIHSTERSPSRRLCGSSDEFIQLEHMPFIILSSCCPTSVSSSLIHLLLGARVSLLVRSGWRHVHNKVSAILLNSLAVRARVCCITVMHFAGASWAHTGRMSPMAASLTLVIIWSP